jgi:hypothetical protein
MTRRNANWNNGVKWAKPVISGTRPASLGAPIFLGLALHRRRGRILDLEPMRRSPRAVGRAQPFRHDALATQLAGVVENDLGVALEELIDDNA